MTRGLAGTSLFIAGESGRPVDAGRLPDEIAVSVITVGALRAGVRVATDVETRDRRLTTLRRAQLLEPIPIDQAVAEAWAKLRVLLRDTSQRMPVNDSWIAATAISLGVPMGTQDGDYGEVLGLEILSV